MILFDYHRSGAEQRSVQQGAGAHAGTAVTGVVHNRRDQPGDTSKSLRHEHARDAFTKAGSGRAEVAEAVCATQTSLEEKAWELHRRGHVRQESDACCFRQDQVWSNRDRFGICLACLIASKRIPVLFVLFS